MVELDLSDIKLEGNEISGTLSEQNAKILRDYAERNPEIIEVRLLIVPKSVFPRT